MSRPDAGADLRHVETWIFDLDNTLYPPEVEFMSLIEGRMTEFVMRETGLGWDEARALQLKYLGENGTTLAGLMANHGVEPMAFLEEVHDVSYDSLTPDPALRAVLARLPGRRLVFTNGHAAHATRVLRSLGLADLIDDVFHLEAAELRPKPDPETYARMVQRHDVRSTASAFFEDTERNLAPAEALGMTTILVGPRAAASTAPFVHHRTQALAPFLMAARINEESAA